MELTTAYLNTMRARSNQMSDKIVHHNVTLFPLILLLVNIFI